MKTYALILVLGASIAVGAETAPNVIGNNTKAEPKDAPWIVSLQIAEDDFAYCGATLIKSMNSSSDFETDHSCSGWVLTAASCLQGISQNSIIASLGNWNLLNAENRIPLNITSNSFVWHEEFNQTSHENDIALFKITFEVKETAECADYSLSVTHPPNFNEAFYDKTSAFFLGWGLLVENGPLQKELYSVSIPLRTDRNCTGYYSHEIFKGDSMMCAGAEGFGPCSYDTGGPLLCNYEENKVTHKWICGIASFGHGCGKAKGPAIFTDIASNNYTGWIEDNTVEKYLI